MKGLTESPIFPYFTRFSVFEDYLEELLRRYQASYDIYRDYKLGDIVYPAYAWFYSHGEKYVLKKEAQLWAIKAYDHVLFLHEEELTAERLEELKAVMTEVMEPQLVRQGEKYPVKDHMTSYLTLAILTDRTPDAETRKAIRRFRFDKGYMMNFRGHSEGHVICACLDSGEVICNRLAKPSADLYRDVYRKVREAAAG